MRNNRTLILLICGVVLALSMALFPPVPEQARDKFQQQSVSSFLLEYGETGKILKKIGILHPLENQRNDERLQQNVFEVLGRAEQDRKRWLHLGTYKEYLNSGVFCYIEMRTEETRVPFVVSYHNGQNWQRIESFPITAEREIYPFFLDLEENSVSLDFFFRNRQNDIEIQSIAFIKPGYHPIVIYDPISYSNFTRDAEKLSYSVESDHVRIFPRDVGSHFKFNLSFRKEWMAGIGNFQKKQGRSSTELTTRKRHPFYNEQLLSNETLLSKSGVKVPIIAVDIREEDLFSDQFGILKNFSGRGREWERLAKVRFIDNGDLIFDTFTGLRLHGGNPGREKGLLNFRVYFRDEYGESFVEAGNIFPGESGKLKRVAIKQSQWEEWPLNTPIAYDIARKVGSLAPPTRLVQLYLNGQNKGLYYLVPHLGETQVDLMFPDKNLKFFKYRGRQHAASLYFVQSDFWHTIGQAGQFNEAFADQYFDLDNLIGQIISITFAGTGDFCQGVILKDMAADSKLFWVMWDMDHSFLDIMADIDDQPKLYERWEKSPSLSSFFEVDGKIEEDCPKSYLFKLLADQDPAYRTKAITTIVSALNHQLSDNYLTNLLFTYWDKLDEIDYPHRQEYIGRLSSYFHNRKAFLIREISELDPSSKFTSCEVISKRPFKVENHLKTGGYTGYHPVGEQLEISVAGSADDTEVVVNNQPVVGTRFSYTVPEDGNCRVHIDMH